MFCPRSAREASHFPCRQRQDGTMCSGDDIHYGAVLYSTMPSRHATMAKKGGWVSDMTARLCRSFEA